MNGYLPAEALTTDPSKILMILHMWKDIPATVSEHNVGQILAAALGLELPFVVGFQDAWNYRRCAFPGNPAYADGVSCGGYRNLIMESRRGFEERN